MAEEIGVAGASEGGAVEGDGNEGIPKVGGQTGGDPAGAGNDPGLIDPMQLPEEMRGKTPGEISLMWQAAARVLESKNTETESQNARIAMLEAEALDRKKSEPATVSDPTADEMKELMFDDPVKALDLLLEKKYGSTVARLESGIGETEIIRVARTIGDDFDEYEPTVRAILSKSSGPIDEAAVHGAFLMARGLAAVELEKKQKKLAAETPAPTPEITEGDASTKLTGLAQEIQRGSGLSEEDFAKYSEGELVTEVPGIN